MAFILTPLPPLPHTSPSNLYKKLPASLPLFSVPPLQDRPQNPILDALEISSPPDLAGQYLDKVGLQNEACKTEGAKEELWTEKSVLNAKRGTRKNQTLSWDTLRKTFPMQSMSTPFLSEQANDAFDAVRHHNYPPSEQPRLDDPSLQQRHISPPQLFDQLMMNVVGNSSSLYIWEVEQECFVSRGAGIGGRQVVTIEGLDDVATDSVIKRFLRIGTLMRRLETMVISFQGRSSNSTMHAFAHAVATVLLHIRSSLTRKSPYSVACLTGMWLYQADAESLLCALAELCGRKENAIPPYQPLAESPAVLLSHVYKHLQRHIEHRSPRHITAMTAYILTASSRIYFAGIGESLGIHRSSRQSWLLVTPLSRKDLHYWNDIAHLKDVELDHSIVSSSPVDPDEDDFPDFFPPELVEALPAARSSLRILQATDPDHPVCSTPAVVTCEWVWTPAEIERLWAGRDSYNLLEGVPEDPHNRPPVTNRISQKDYRRELHQFRLFDLDPGVHLAGTSAGPPPIESFLSSFPERLPPLTPTLQHLVAVILQPLVKRTALLSRSILRFYLTSMHLETHLALLRSYLLLTFPSFKYRLFETLFSDPDGYWPVGRGKRTLTRGKLGIRDARDITDGSGPVRGIGLSHSLAERDTWPPGGTDLGFVLRTVIVDSLERRTIENDSKEATIVWREAEAWMGFALRDFPIGDGKERWLNPASIEALDFLYLNYKPPYPLDVVITYDVLSKYQRIFTFLLRLFRAETVTRIIFRSLFGPSGIVFEYAPKAQAILVRLRFQIQAFVTSFMAYVFDSAIHSNFDAYMRRISALREDILGHTFTPNGHDITDVLTLRESHSMLLDQILSGCLLKSTQRAAGDALRDILELILRFGNLLINFQQRHLTEICVTQELLGIDELYREHMLSFIKIIQALHVKEQISNKSPCGQDLSCMVGKDGIYMEHYSLFKDILVRIDPTGWWRQKLEIQNECVP